MRIAYAKHFHCDRFQARYSDTFFAFPLLLPDPIGTDQGLRAFYRALRLGHVRDALSV